MDATFAFGLGVTLVGSFARWRFPKIANPLASAGLAVGLGLIAMSFFPGIKTAPAALTLVAVALLAIAVELQLAVQPVHLTVKDHAVGSVPTAQPTAASDKVEVATEHHAGMGNEVGAKASLRAKVDRKAAVFPMPTSAGIDRPDQRLASPGPTLVEQIAKFITEGEAIQAHFMATDDGQGMKTEQEAWAKRVEAFLSAEVGVAQATQFRITDANPMDGQPAGRSEAGGYHWAKIVARNKLLATYMMQVQSH